MVLSFNRHSRQKKYITTHFEIFAHFIVQRRFIEVPQKPITSTIDWYVMSPLLVYEIWTECVGFMNLLYNCTRTEEIYFIKQYDMHKVIVVYVNMKYNLPLWRDILSVLGTYLLRDDLKFGGFFILSISNSRRVHSFCKGGSCLSDACIKLCL